MNALSTARVCFAWALLLVVDVGIQVAMKLAGDELASIPIGTEWAKAALASRAIWIAIAGYLVTLVLWLLILRVSSLGAAFATTALVYVLVPLAGWWFFGERLGYGRTAGIALIIVGVLIQFDGIGGIERTANGGPA